MIANRNAAEPDIVLVGAGIMSATLGTVLKELEPTLNIVLFETLHDCALESSEGWNNAGTGHAANCELNYTPQRPDGSVDISKALEVNTEFDLSRQLWSFLVTKGAIPDPGAFINACPHMSFVWGAGNVAFLRQRFKEMSAHHCYHGMEYSEDRSKIATWAPLIMDERDDKEPFAAMVSLIFAAAFGTLAISFWPYMIPFSITIAEAAAPHSSLAFMFWGAGLFVFPLMLIYTAISYSVFRGKVASSGSGY